MLRCKDKSRASRAYGFALGSPTDQAIDRLVADATLAARADIGSSAQDLQCQGPQYKPCYWQLQPKPAALNPEPSGEMLGGFGRKRASRPRSLKTMAHDERRELAERLSSSHGLYLFLFSSRLGAVNVNVVMGHVSRSL